MSNESISTASAGSLQNDDDLKSSFDPSSIKNPIFRIISEWCQDDCKKSVLYLKNGSERYPDFQLYKKIARNVTKHVPKDQLSRPEFQAFVDKSKNNNIKNLIDIDAIEEF